MTFHMMNTLYDVLNEEERLSLEQSVNDHMNQLEETREQLANAETDSVNRLTKKLEKVLHPHNFPKYFKGDDGGELTRNQIITGTGTVTINNREYSYSEAKQFFYDIDPASAEDYFKSKGVTTFTTPGADDWLKSRVDIATASAYVPDSIAHELFTRLKSNGGVLNKQDWDEITGGKLGDWDENYGGDSMFFGIPAQGDIAEHIDNVQSEAYQNISKLVALKLSDPDILAFVNDNAPRTLDTDLLNMDIGNVQQYQELLDTQKGEFFVTVMTNIEQRLIEAESDKKIIDLDNLMQSIVPSIFQDQFNTKRVDFNRRITDLFPKTNKSTELRDGQRYFIFHEANGLARAEIKYDIFDKDPQVALESVDNILAVFAQADFKLVEPNNLKDNVMVSSPKQLQQELINYQELLRLEIDTMAQVNTGAIDG